MPEGPNRTIHTSRGAMKRRANDARPRRDNHPENMAGSQKFTRRYKKGNRHLANHSAATIKDTERLQREWRFKNGQYVAGMSAPRTAGK
jgi:hypothetical protein